MRTTAARCLFRICLSDDSVAGGNRDVIADARSGTAGGGSYDVTRRGGRVSGGDRQAARRTKHEIKRHQLRVGWRRQHLSHVGPSGAAAPRFRFSNPSFVSGQ